jgi:uncharacterized protein YhaN
VELLDWNEGLGSIQALLQEVATWDSTFHENENRVVEVQDQVMKLEQEIAKMPGGHDLGLDVERAQQMLAAKRQEQDTLHQLVGRLGQRRQDLETDTKLQSLTNEQFELEAEIAKQADRWLDMQLMLGLLQHTQQHMKSQHQGPVLDRASAILRTLTEDEWVQVIPVEKDEYALVHRGGEHRFAKQLNRSLLERLYLSLRLGYVDVYCEDHEPLPLVLDDVLVNFDPEHADRTARFLVEFSRKLQIFYLTCHPATTAIFERVSGSDAVQFWELRDYEFAARGIGHLSGR